MKKFISILVATFALLNSAMAIDQVNVIASNTPTVLLSQPVQIASVTVANATGVTATVCLVDSSSKTSGPNGNGLTYTRAAFTTTTSYTTNMVTDYTNINGVATSVTNSALYTLTSTTAATTNNYRVINTIVVPANTTLTWTPVNGAYANNGVLSTNSAAVTVTTSYSTTR